MDIIMREWSTYKDVKPDVYAVDKDGVTLRLTYIGEMFFDTLPNVKDFVSALPDLDTRKDDIFITAYCKCGTNWVYEIANMLLRQDASPIRGLKMELFIEYTRPDFRDMYPSPRILNTHVRPKFLPRRAMANANKIIFLVRNPKDVVVSYYHHTVNHGSYGYKGTFDAYFDLWMDGRVPSGSYFDYVLSWEKYFTDIPEQPVIFLYYEDLKRDLARCIERLSEFLEVPCGPDLLAAIVSNVSLENMKKAKREVVPGAKFQTIFRKGIVGDWKNMLSDHSEAIDVAVMTKMAGSMFKFDYGDE